MDIETRIPIRRSQRLVFQGRQLVAGATAACGRAADRVRQSTARVESSRARLAPPAARPTGGKEASDP